MWTIRLSPYFTLKNGNRKSIKRTKVLYLYRYRIARIHTRTLTHSLTHFLHKYMVFNAQKHLQNSQNSAQQHSKLDTYSLIHINVLNPQNTAIGYIVVNDEEKKAFQLKRK